MPRIVSAVFESPRDAELAVGWLRERGIPDSAISVVTHRDRLTAPAKAPGRRGDKHDPAQGALVGAGAGAGLGMLFGLAAAAIPGVGPLVTAGALAEVLGAAAGG